MINAQSKNNPDVLNIAQIIFHYHKFCIISPNKVFDDIMVYIASPPPPPRPPLLIDRDAINALTRNIFT